MFGKLGYALAPIALAVLVTIPFVAHGGDSWQNAWAEKLGGVWYGPPYNLVLPNQINIEAPAANVPKECTRWLGVWAGGKWHGRRPTALIVHNVSHMGEGWCRAKVTLLQGVSSSWLRGEVEEGGAKNVPKNRPDLPATIHKGELAIGPNIGRNEWSVSYKMGTDGNTLHGKAYSALTDGPTDTIWAKLKRMQLPHKPPGG